MGLSERKNKQRIGHDPRNLSWSDDKTRFSYKHMTTLGWSDASGIGGNDLSGNPNHIVLARKLDNGGIGMARARKDGDDQAAGAGQAGRGLEDVLRRLAGAAEASPSPISDSRAIDGEDTAARRQVVRSRIASRQRHLHNKRLASSSPAALAEILGVPVSSLPYSTPPSVSPALSASTTESFSSPLPSSSSTSVVPERSADEVISTSALSVSDYFRKKMRDKMASRAAASGLTSPKLETIAMIIKDEIKLPGGAAVWRGSQTTFKQEPELPLQTGEPIFRVKQELDIRQTNDSDPSIHRYPATISTVSRPSTASSATDREAKRARKEAKRRHQNLASTSGRMVQKAVIPPSSPTEGQAQQKRKKAERPGKLNDISDQASAGICPKKERKTAVEGLEAGHAEVRQKRKRKSLDGP